MKLVCRLSSVDMATAGRGFHDLWTRRLSQCVPGSRMPLRPSPFHRRCSATSVISMQRAAVLYHYPCSDGVFAALAAHLYHKAIGCPVIFYPNTVYNPLGYALQLLSFVTQHSTPWALIYASAVFKISTCRMWTSCTSWILQDQRGLLWSWLRAQKSRKTWL